MVGSGCVKSESETEISDNSDSILVMKVIPKLLLFVDLDELLDNSISLGTFKYCHLHWEWISYWIFAERTKGNCNFA